MNESARSIEFEVPGDPFGKQRARVAVRGKFAHAFTPKETVNHEAHVKMLASAAMSAAGFRSPFSGPIALRVRAVFRVPQSWSRKKQEAAQRGEILPTVRPDFDNIEKLVSDSCNGIVLLDDKQVVESWISKKYAFSDEGPRLIIRVEEIATGRCA